MRIYLIIVLLNIMMGALPLSVTAEITEKCSNCHSMHDSQDGLFVTATGTNSSLVSISRSTPCWDCHGIGSSGNIEPFTGTPQVMHTAQTDLAGGNFAYVTGKKAGVTGSAKSRGHNVIYTGVTDNSFSTGTYPPGDEFAQSSEGFNNTTFTCAGKFGCHGDRSISDEAESIQGAHHSNNSMLTFGSINESLQGSAVGQSYRYLLGVKGGEDADWEATVSDSDHNEYKGAAGGNQSTKTFPGGNTMSGFCNECHGNFHDDKSSAGGASIWKRHPADISLPGAGTEYANYTTYDPQVPVGRVFIPNAPSSSINPEGTTDDIVMCLSCHRAHASPYKDILRWNYEEMVARGGGSGGCFSCHTAKK